MTCDFCNKQKVWSQTLRVVDGKRYHYQCWLKILELAQTVDVTNLED